MLTCKVKHWFGRHFHRPCSQPYQDLQHLRSCQGLYDESRWGPLPDRRLKRGGNQASRNRTRIWSNDRTTETMRMVRLGSRQGILPLFLPPSLRCSFKCAVLQTNLGCQWETDICSRVQAPAKTPEPNCHSDTKSFSTRLPSITTQPSTSPNSIF